MERMTSKLTKVLVVALLCAAAVTTASSQEKQNVIDVKVLAAKGEVLANEDPLAVELRNQQPEGSARRGFNIGMGVAEGHTLPGPGKARLCDALLPGESQGCSIAVLFSVERNRNADLAARGAAITKADPVVAEARNTTFRYKDLHVVFYWLGFDIGMAAAEGQTAPGPGKQKIHDLLNHGGTLVGAEQRGFDTAVAFSLDRNRNAKLAEKGAEIAHVDPVVAEARNTTTDVFYWPDFDIANYRLGFDIATGIFGDPALGAQGNTAVGPGSLKIRDSLSPAGQRGFNASVRLHLGQAPPSSAPEQRPRPSGEATAIDNFGKRSTALDRAYGDLSNVGAEQVVSVGKDSGGAANILGNLPFIDDVRVRPDARDVIISFTSTQQTPPLIEIGKVAPAPDSHGILAFPVGSGAFSRFVPGENGKYSLNLGALGEQLDIGTTYYYNINVFNDDKNNTKRPREQVTGKFTTLPQTVKVIFTDLRILTGPLNLTSLYQAKYVFYFDVYVDDTRLGRSQLGTGNQPVVLAQGKTSLRGEEIVIENSPDDLWIAVTGLQDANQPPRNLNSKQSYTTFAEGVTGIAAAAGRPTYASGSFGGVAGYYNHAVGSFDLSGYRLGPGDSVSIPFTLPSKPLGGGKFDGFLAFEISGRIEVTRH